MNRTIKAVAVVLLAVLAICAMNLSADYMHPAIGYGLHPLIGIPLMIVCVAVIYILINDK